MDLSHTRRHAEVSEPLGISSGGIPTHTVFGGTRSSFLQFFLHIPQCHHIVTGPYIYASSLEWQNVFLHRTHRAPRS